MNKKAPELKVPCHIYSRSVGYYANLDTWNPGQLAQFHNRKYLNIDKAKSKLFSPEIKK